MRGVMHRLHYTWKCEACHRKCPCPIHRDHSLSAAAAAAVQVQQAFPTPPDQNVRVPGTGTGSGHFSPRRASLLLLPVRTSHPDARRRRRLCLRRRGPRHAARRPPRGLGGVELLQRGWPGGPRHGQPPRRRLLPSRDELRRARAATLLGGAPGHRRRQPPGRGRPVPGFPTVHSPHHRRRPLRAGQGALPRRPLPGARHPGPVAVLDGHAQERQPRHHRRHMPGERPPRAPVPADVPLPVPRWSRVHEPAAGVPQPHRAGRRRPMAPRRHVRDLRPGRRQPPRRRQRLLLLRDMGEGGGGDRRRRWVGVPPQAAHVRQVPVADAVPALRRHQGLLRRLPLRHQRHDQTGAGVAGLQGAVHPGGEAGRRAQQPVLPHGHGQLLEERRPRLRRRHGDGRDAVQRDDHQPVHAGVVHAVADRPVPAVAHLPERQPRAPHRRSPLPLRRLPRVLLPRERGERGAAHQLLRRLQQPAGAGDPAAAAAPRVGRVRLPDGERAGVGRRPQGVGARRRSHVAGALLLPGPRHAAGKEAVDVARRRHRDLHQRQGRGGGVDAQWLRRPCAGHQVTATGQQQLLVVRYVA